ncbi:MAG: LAGLIDADG family homing endonuclease [Patescibacteria group bacterium]
MELSGDYIAGFVDGEGCFALKFRRDIKHERKNKPIYFYWDIEFAIVLREDDKEILEKIQAALGCGYISFTKRGMVRYSVSEINELLNKIALFFEKYPLHAKKKYDFLLWKEAVEIFKKNQRSKLNRKKGEKGFHKVIWNKGDLSRLKEIHEEMKKYKSGNRDWKWL